MLEHATPIGTIAYMGGLMSLPEPFCWSLLQLAEFSREALCGPGSYIHYAKTGYSLHDAARNELASKIQGDWILMLDTDLAFEPDLAARLVRWMTIHDLDVVTGLYAYKANGVPILYMETEQKIYEPVSQWDPTLDLFEVASAGGGNLLIRRRVFDRIRQELNGAVCRPHRHVRRGSQLLSAAQETRDQGVLRAQNAIGASGLQPGSTAKSTFRKDNTLRGGEFSKRARDCRLNNTKESTWR